MYSWPEETIAFQRKKKKNLAFYVICVEAKPLIFISMHMYYKDICINIYSIYAQTHSTYLRI